jgi:hypothetical protein
VPVWFKPFLVVLAGMVLLVLGGAPLDPNQHNWRTKLADPMTLRIFGAVLVGMGVCYGFVSYQGKPARKRKR